MTEKTKNIDLGDLGSSLWYPLWDAGLRLAVVTASANAGEVLRAAGAPPGAAPSRSRSPAAAPAPDRRPAVSPASRPTMRNSSSPAKAA